MPENDSKKEKIKRLVEKYLHNKKKKHKKVPKHKAQGKDKASKPESASHRGAGKPKKTAAVFQGPHGGSYVVLGNGKKKYGVSKSMVEALVKEDQITEFIKKHKGDK